MSHMKDRMIDQMNEEQQHPNEWTYFLRTGAILDYLINKGCD